MIPNKTFAADMTPPELEPRPFGDMRAADRHNAAMEQVAAAPVGMPIDASQPVTSPMGSDTGDMTDDALDAVAGGGGAFRPWFPRPSR